MTVEVIQADRALELWFFRDLSDEQRGSLFRLAYGADIAKEASNHGTQRIVLKRLKRDLARLSTTTRVDATDGERFNLAAELERLRRLADPDGRIALPIVADEDGRKVGIARRKPEEMLNVEAHVDASGTVWMPPTAWAYMAACLSRQPAAEADEVGKWQAIGTAPRDGTWFLACSNEPGWGATRIVRFVRPDDRFPIHGEGVMWPSAPTHWMRLPDKPARTALNRADNAEG